MLLNFSFCKYILPHPTSICSKLMLSPGALLFTLSIYLIRLLLVEIPGTKHLTYLLILDFTFKTCICGWYLKKIAVVGYIFVIFLDLLLMRPNTLKYLSKFSWKLFYRALLQFHKFASNLRPARSTRLQMVFKIGVLKYFAISTGRQLCFSLQLLCFPLNIAKYLKTAFL